MLMSAEDLRIRIVLYAMSPRDFQLKILQAYLGFGTALLQHQCIDFFSASSRRKMAFFGETPETPLDISNSRGESVTPVAL